MNTPDLPPKEEGYRMVRFREVLDDETEFYDAFERKWVPISASSIGLPLDADSVGHFRRPTK